LARRSFDRVAAVELHFREDPDKPIEVNLNVTIKQEVLVRLQRDVEQLINQNPQAFPQPQQPQPQPPK
jgi:hypothetical protein